MDMRDARSGHDTQARSPVPFSPAMSSDYSGSDPFRSSKSTAMPLSRDGHYTPNGSAHPPTTGYTSAPNVTAATAASSSSTPGSSIDHPMGREPASPVAHHQTPVVSASQKRAYRQRRKDPSCDACRERKVKCDATDTSSCSECSSRNVKCQFTKETNRRMSSMKQVQDLERQLQQIRKHNNDLTHRLQEKAPSEPSSSSIVSTPTLSLPDPNVRERRPVIPSIVVPEAVRSNIRDISRGIFPPPAPYRNSAPEPLYPFSGQTLPPRHIVERLLENYHRSVHAAVPLLHWPTFYREFEDVYQAGTLEHSRQIWVALFFAVLACGTLMDYDARRDSTEETDGSRYLGLCLQTMNTWSDELNIDHARTSLLVSTYFMEVNLRSPAWIWLGAAVRVAQGVGLHAGDTGFPPMELEMRRRVWWSIYYWDRVVSLEVGRPLMINDDDCNVGEPTPVDDTHIHPNGVVPGQTSPNALLAVVPVVRTTAQLKKTFRLPTIAKSTLDTCDEHFRTIMETWPEPLHHNSRAPLDPRLLTAACSLSTQRFFLYRHNLSPNCRAVDRQDSLARCVYAAEETVRYIERSFHHEVNSAERSPPAFAHHPTWVEKVRSASTAFFCTHLWRCELVTCLRGQYDMAWVLVQASTAIGNLRKNNVSCGRFLAFFLDKIINKLHSGITQQQLEADEEMLAYVSGDLQGSAEEAWIWHGGQMGTSAPVKAPSSYQSGQNNANGQNYYADKPGLQAEKFSTATLNEQEAQEWGGWDAIQGRLRHLMHGAREADSGPHDRSDGRFEQQGQHQTSQQAQQAQSHHTSQLQRRSPPPQQYQSAPPVGREYDAGGPSHYSHSGSQHHAGPSPHFHAQHHAQSQHTQQQEQQHQQPYQRQQQPPSQSQQYRHHPPSPMNQPHQYPPPRSSQPHPQQHPSQNQQNSTPPHPGHNLPPLQQPQATSSPHGSGNGGGSSSGGSRIRIKDIM